MTLWSASAANVIQSENEDGAHAIGPMRDGELAICRVALAAVPRWSARMGRQCMRSGDRDARGREAFALVRRAECERESPLRMLQRDARPREVGLDSDA